VTASFGTKVMSVTVSLLLSSALSATAPSALAATEPPAAPAPIVLDPLPASSGTAPTAAGVQTAIGSLVARQLKGSSVLVVDPASGQVLLDQRGSRARIPASTVKLATAAAALDVLGAATTLPTIASRDGDTVYLVGSGDPTLARSGQGDPAKGGRPSLKALASAVAADYGVQRAVTVVYDASAFDGPGLGPGWSSSFPKAGVVAPVSALVVDSGRVSPGARSRVQNPAKQAAELFSSYLRSDGLKVKRTKRGPLDPGAAEIARVESASIGDIVQHMLTDSENDYAEALAHLVGGKALGQPSFAGGAEATVASLARLGVDTSGVTLVDGSGLSRQNRVPPATWADLLTDVVTGTNATLVPISAGLPIAGLTGTLADRFGSRATKAGRGFVHAKTGTLTGVVSLAGTVLDADGRILVFAMTDDKARSLAKVRETMDTVASRLAACGCG